MPKRKTSQDKFELYIQWSLDVILTLPVKNMPKTILLLLLIVASSSASAEWSKLKETDDKTQYIDYTSIRKYGGFVRAWFLVDLKKKEELGNSSLVYVYEFDCREERRRWLSVYFFSGQMGLGETIEKLTTPEEWEYFREDPILPMVCHDWVKLGNDLYIDPVTIRKNRQFVTGWVLIDGLQGDEYGASSLRLQYEYDCEGRRERNIYISSHSGLMASGDLLFFGAGEKKWKSAEAVSKTAFEYVCQ